MRIEFISRSVENSRLIILMAGWSTDPRFYSGVERDGWDVAVAYDYESMDYDREAIASYSTRYLYAWSLGVFAAAVSGLLREADKAVAVNGTLFPADDELGIPVRIYKDTAARLDERNLRKFRNRLFSSSRDFLRREADFPDHDDIESLRRQLLNIAAAAPAQQSKGWTHAYISADDRIFPAANQQRAWERCGVPFTLMEGEPHCTDIRHIVAATTPNTVFMGERFRSSLATYDANAPAQRFAARHLCEMIVREMPHGCGSILEVGYGSGLFTRLYAPLLHPASADFIDLYSAPKIDIFPKENYVAADAERWLQSQPADRQWDCILSANAIQWFANPKLFIESCRRHIAADGMLAISTFAPGNLGELNVLRPEPLNYLSAEELAEVLHRNFSEVNCESLTYRLEFSNVRELLLHLKRTGVGGIESGSRPRNIAEIGRLLQPDPDVPLTLTYRPICITARP